MRARLPWIVAALQIVLLAFMAGEREWVARTGTPVVLRTAPIDPRDPMRGDYVRAINDNGRRTLLRALRMSCGWRTSRRWLGMYSIDTSTVDQRAEFAAHIERAMSELR